MLHISESELSEMQFAMEQILTAKYVFEKTGVHISPYRYIKALEFDVEFFIDALELIFQINPSYGASHDEDNLEIYFEWDIWKRIIEIEMSEEQREALTVLVGEHSQFVGIVVGDILYEDNGVIRIKCEDFTYMYNHSVIKELIDVEKKLINFEKNIKGENENE
ncbi:hypothetical protein [Peribacillus asahii]|uniref:hypothetical protein n=1 Tax=Peribacillus asahii TaxID=228899 RepID=UPI002079FC81|nr:hypothetical protein [Peribacillus asahii]USK62236.1 hypothetical protein LIT37_23980 [Peribacillus asahii]